MMSKLTILFTTLILMLYFSSYLTLETIPSSSRFEINQLIKLSTSGIGKSPEEKENSFEQDNLKSNP